MTLCKNVAVRVYWKFLSQYCRLVNESSTWEYRCLLTAVSRWVVNALRGTCKGLVAQFYLKIISRNIHFNSCLFCSDIILQSRIKNTSLKFPHPSMIIAQPFSQLQWQFSRKMANFSCMKRYCRICERKESFLFSHSSSENIRLRLQVALETKAKM